MEFVGGFMTMLVIFGFVLTVVWLILPFVVLAMKAKIDRSYLLLENIELRLAAIEQKLGRNSSSGPATTQSAGDAAPFSPAE